MKDYGKKTGLFLLISLLAAGQTTAFGALSGSGTREDPVYGSPEIYPGDTVKPGAWFRSLTPVDGKTLVFSPVLSPREYQLIFDAEGGNIPQYGSRLSLRVRYNDGSGACSDTIQLPPEPVKAGSSFQGWFLKGNQSPDGTLLRNGSRYMIATEDAGDRSKADMEGDSAVARALWRTAQAPDPGDGQGPDDPAGGGGGDAWEPAHSNNHVIEKIPEAEDKEAYRRLHGRTAYQYGRILFDASTNRAQSYVWYVDGRKQAETGPEFLLSDITRSLEGAKVRCDAVLEGGTSLRYETELTVYYLPEIRETAFSYEKVE